MPENPNTIARDFIKTLAIYSVVITLVSFAVKTWVQKLPLTSSYLFIIVFMFIVTVSILWLLDKSMNTKLSHFTNAFMLLNFGKLLLYTIIIFVYSYLNTEDAVSFIISFFVYYLLFSGFEIFVLLKINQQKNN